jgi:hypothetical protein
MKVPVQYYDDDGLLCLLQLSVNWKSGVLFVELLPYVVRVE